MTGGIVLPADQAVLVDAVARAVHTGDAGDVDELRRVMHGMSAVGAARFDTELRAMEQRFPQRDRLCRICAVVADELDPTPQAPQAPQVSQVLQGRMWEGSR